jgi:hypothetical protein
MKQQAWSLKAIDEDDLRYWGNDGYHDDSSIYYRYDNFVANHKNVKKGDIVIITNRKKVLGVSVVDKVSSNNFNKKRNVCIHVDCAAKKIMRRKKAKPEWRCSKGHEFETPRSSFQSAVEFIAMYDKNYLDVNNVSLDDLIKKTPRYNVQMSIQEIDLPWALSLVSSHKTLPLDIDESDADEELALPILHSEDRRAVIERQIKQRRGQKSFRNSLLNSRSTCAVTGCELIDILEAAHIDAYRNDSHNHISNGLLLRSDIHTLFDLNLCAIEPNDKTIHFSSCASNSGYNEFDGKKIMINHNISKVALQKRWDLFISL